MQHDTALLVQSMTGFDGRHNRRKAFRPALRPEACEYLVSNSRAVVNKFNRLGVDFLRQNRRASQFGPSDGQRIMMKTNGKKPATALAALTGMMGLLVLSVVAWTERDSSQERDGAMTGGKLMPVVRNLPAGLPGLGVAWPSPILAVPAPVLPASANIALLDRRRQFALGMIETGNRDGEIGQAGEVSRYQIMPSVWKHYSDSSGYRDPEVSLAVAQKHWAALCSSFKQQAHREPDDFDMYILWNTRYGYYASKGFHPARLHPVVCDRARRFVNLLVRGGV